MTGQGRELLLQHNIRPSAGRSAWLLWQGRAQLLATQLLATLLLAVLLCAQPPARAAAIVAGPSGSPASLADAVAAAKDGDVIELLSGDYSGSLLLENRRLTLRGMGKVLFSGEGKAGPAHALITVRGGDVVLENLQFRGMRANDGSGAGVRQEGGRLLVRGCEFFDNEHGLLATNDDKAELSIDLSAFGMAPRVVGGLYHLLNVGRIGKLRIVNSRFQQGFEGHLIKSRAREAFIGYNFIHDGVRGGASYEIELAAGGVATVIGNVIAQGADSQNPVSVAYGTEGRTWERNTLYLAHNTFVNYGWAPAWFLRTFLNRLPAGSQVFAINNLLVGPGIFGLGASGQFHGNRHATRGMLRDIETYGFELAPGSVWRGSGVDPRSINGQDLSPKFEYEWGSVPTPLAPGRTSWTPGAYQR